jgi:Transport protein particle (TRAPP) component
VDTILVVDSPSGLYSCVQHSELHPRPDLRDLVKLCVVIRLTRDRERLVDMLEIMKFLCRSFWKEAFQHQVDKLQTNHKVFVQGYLVRCRWIHPRCPLMCQGVYVLVDNTFAWIRYFSSPEGQDTKTAALRFLALPCGVIRGALASFGLDCIVTVDVITLPQCTLWRPPLLWVALTILDFVGPLQARLPSKSKASVVDPVGRSQNNQMCVLKMTGSLVCRHLEGLRLYLSPCGHPQSTQAQPAIVEVMATLHLLQASSKPFVSPSTAGLPCFGAVG